MTKDGEMTTSGSSYLHRPLRSEREAREEIVRELEAVADLCESNLRNGYVSIGQVPYMRDKIDGLRSRARALRAQKETE